MTTPDTPSGYNDKPPRRRLPVWVWGVSACACLPIAAVILLGAALTPVFKRVREARRETESTNFCISNARQIATSMQMYVQDYDDTYPASRNWMDGISPYLGNPNTDKTHNVLQCPTVRAVQPTGYGYAFNSSIAGKSAAKLSSPGRIPLVYDSSNLVKNASDAVSSLPNPARHRQRGIRGLKGQHVNTVSYADGHVKAQTTDGKTFIIPGMPNN